MKTALLNIICLGVLGSATSHPIDILALLHGAQKKKPQNEDPTGILSRVMAAASQSLSFAEKKQEIAVQAARGDLEVLLTKQGSALTRVIQQYNSSLANSMRLVRSHIATSKSVLEKAEKESSGDSWDSTTGHDQATLKAQLSMAQTVVRTKQRQHAASMRQAVSDGDMLLEDGVTQLSRKTGDISDMVKKTQLDIETAAAVEPKTSVIALAQTSLDLDKATAALRAANQQVAQSDEAAHKRITADFDKIEKDLAAGAKAIGDKLEISQEEALKGVRSASAANGFTKPKPALRKAKKHM